MQVLNAQKRLTLFLRNLAHVWVRLCSRSQLDVGRDKMWATVTLLAFRAASAPRPDAHTYSAH